MDDINILYGNDSVSVSTHKALEYNLDMVMWLAAKRGDKFTFLDTSENLLQVSNCQD